jgi:hypothetical protein
VPVVRFFARADRACRQSTIRSVRSSMVASGTLAVLVSESRRGAHFGLPRPSARPGRFTQSSHDRCPRFRALAHSQTNAPSLRTWFRTSAHWTGLCFPSSGGHQPWAWVRRSSCPSVARKLAVQARNLEHEISKLAELDRRSPRGPAQVLVGSPVIRLLSCCSCPTTCERSQAFSGR